MTALYRRGIRESDSIDGGLARDVVAELRRAGCVFAEDEARLILAAAGSAGGNPAATSAGDSAGDVDRMIARRVIGEPLEHILGWVDFRGLRLRVGPGVFVPRQRTAWLVDSALPLVHPSSRVLDLCCGCGALGAALCKAVPSVTVVASDIDPVAADYARANLAESAPAEVFVGDLFDALPRRLRGSFDLVVANAPYVPTAALGMLPREAKLYEPEAALDGGDDGLDPHRRILGEVASWLSPGGSVVMEAGESQLATLIGLFRANGFSARATRDEERDATAVVGSAVGAR